MNYYQTSPSVLLFHSTGRGWFVDFRMIGNPGYFYRLIGVSLLIVDRVVRGSLL
jgi:hypothetical protein